ncbi:putative nitric oxide synthase-interacting protein [Monocercomonoides exilis]|uniref:putative nitric oxide synthase-interacting protein n=1 Tax=Monocercomonoides exilis TaxID=2049356 RepID=UPI00355A698C|nr:putative nitric oxide synthase-interacting protein [Monocercomonoides exilis]|eukprot:MONOS_6324.1-p1 / transcript=MONOS_6324.1 / gene=MONOS_6324 / organism=Monocercomonoides_exilis_PA203 / gene_product=unspecified product / transcript_product=unspecified product / location=Mono_scaffold00197:81976-82468(-) / protein_length=99 / sequence_SO=supercontig / SO=protein_coding / is_pseudo=false
MSRHSLNRNTRAYFSASERAEAGYGTKRQRVGADGFKGFGCCTLCLEKARNPVTCLEGHLFCKECLAENLGKQKEVNGRRLKELKALQAAEAVWMVVEG